jgi:hypothetical protein
MFVDVLSESPSRVAVTTTSASALSFSEAMTRPLSSWEAPWSPEGSPDGPIGEEDLPQAVTEVRTTNAPATKSELVFMVCISCSDTRTAPAERLTHQPDNDRGVST